VIVIYKVDRLTRSLADFAKIVEVLDAAKASFVSITQAFNTTTSMGRLTLNMLLSFSQFEREITGERIRDKIAASKRKGLWMGGPVPLGYEVRERKLVVNESEAELVRHIMRRYLELGSVIELAAELNRQGHRTKVQNRASGPHRGGCEFRRGTLYHLLTNRIYLGRVVHKGQHFDGEHQPIVTTELWEAVQEALKARASGTSVRLRARNPSLLVGLLFDGEGRAMTPSHATKPGKRYRYYITRPDELDGSPAWRVSAHDLDALVCARLSDLLLEQDRLVGLLQQPDDAPAVQALLRQADLAAAELRSGSTSAKAQLIPKLIERIDLHDDHISIAILPAALLGTLGLAVAAAAEDTLLVECAATKVRRGHQLRLIIPGPEPVRKVRRDEKLVTLIAEARSVQQLVLASPGRPIASIAAEAGRCRARMTRLLSVACLAPDIIARIVEGRQPATLTAQTLLAADLPVAWADQRLALGLA
jgi:site-specific DNA recombinase